jgi:hypothetical protein
VNSKGDENREDDDFRDRDEITDLSRLRGPPEIDVREDQGGQNGKQLLGGKKTQWASVKSFSRSKWRSTTETWA